jgi:F0F1-type ATP synthase assembly protein I
MTDLVGRGKRLVLRIAVAQLACTLAVALVFAWRSGPAAAVAALAGGLIAVIGGVAFGWRMFAPGIAPAAKLARAMYAGEALKWLWTVLALWAALAWLHLPSGPLLAGLVVAMLGHWLGLIGMKG